MRILLDECVNPRLRLSQIMKSRPDAKLMAQAQSQCDLLVTIDRGFEHEPTLKKLAFEIVIFHVQRNRMFPALVDPVENVKVGDVTQVSAPPV